MMRHPKFVMLLALMLILPLGLAAQSKDFPRAAISAAAPGGCAEFSFLAESAAGGGDVIHGFDPANLDRSVSPCDDFYKFAVGGWIKNHPIPAEYPVWSTFNALDSHNEDALHEILEDAAKDRNAKPGSNWQKIGDYFGACMDEAQVEAAGTKPLEGEFQRINGIKDTAGLQEAVARLQRQGVGAIFEFGSEQDFKDSTQVIAAVGQGGLGLPDRQYYLQDDEKSKQLRADYIRHVTNMFELLGDDATTSAAEADTVMKIETSMAKVSMDRADLRDPEKVYHKMTLAQLRDLTPHFDWVAYIKEAGAPPTDAVDINQPDFFKAMDASLTSVPLADWKTYLRWHLIHASAPALPKKFVDEDFSFYGRTLTGAKEMHPRWRRCVQDTDRALGEALGQYYVERYFPPEAKARALGMVKNLIAALHDDLATLDWMSPVTRQKATEKLNAITLKIGYPDKWRDYTALKVDRASYAENRRRANEFESARDAAKIGKPVDRTEWGMTPPTVNAYYNPMMNEIVFPAGILQPPFFDPNADDAINYGGIGAVIGHEMTHGFDDEGAQFDPQGNLKNWWTDEDLKNFKSRGDCIAQQFDSIEVEPGLHENGKLVEGESIADLGGLTISYAAFKKSLEGKPAPPPINGFTADQRFFLGFAQIWSSNYRPEYARLRVKTNEHPLGQYRTDGPLSNMPSFSRAFGCSANSLMVRPAGKRCRIW